MLSGHPLLALAKGERPAGDGLLEAARLSWDHLEIRGWDEIMSAMRMRGAPGSANETAATLSVDGPANAALFCDGFALFADMYEGRAGRLWRIGDAPDPDPAPPRRVDVAFDADMSQFDRQIVKWRREDHPHLSARHSDGLLEACHAVVEDGLRAGALRQRAFVLRAFSQGDAAAALLWIHALEGREARAASSRFAVVGQKGGGDAVVTLGRPAASEWRPRL